MPSSKPKLIKLGLSNALIHGISDNDRYFCDSVQEQMEPEFQAHLFLKMAFA